jgi:hypothetical protein
MGAQEYASHVQQLGEELDKIIDARVAEAVKPIPLAEAFAKHWRDDAPTNDSMLTICKPK